MSGDSAHLVIVIHQQHSAIAPQVVGSTRSATGAEGCAGQLSKLGK